MDMTATDDSSADVTVGVSFLTECNVAIVGIHSDEQDALCEQGLRVSPVFDQNC
jgi:hypothetical protein